MALEMQTALVEPIAPVIKLLTPDELLGVRKMVASTLPSKRGSKEGENLGELWGLVCRIR